MSNAFYAHWNVCIMYMYVIDVCVCVCLCIEQFEVRERLLSFGAEFFVF